MGLLKIEKLKPDMVLTDDVKDINARLLLKKGQKIALNHIKIMKTWGVTEVAVQGADDSASHPETVLDPEHFKRVAEDTKPLFKHVDLKHPAIKEIFRLSVMCRSRYKIEAPHADGQSQLTDSEDGHIVLDLKAKIAEQAIKLPEIPVIVFELNEVVNDPVASADDIAQVVKKSPSLAALLLRIVNSAFYGFPAQIDTITRAVAIIGTKEISSLAMGIVTIKMFKDIPRQVLDMQAFLQHSLACGIIARIMAARKNIPQTEQMFVSGLLHDLGRLMVYQYYPDLAKGLLNHCLSNQTPLYEVEGDFLGCQHTDLGRYLLRAWQLPPTLENNLYFHHNPSEAGDQVSAGIVHLADLMVNALGIGTSGSHFVPCLDEDAWMLLDLSPACFETVVEQATHQLFALETHLAS